MDILQTPRLLLRPITKDDVEDVFSYSKHPNVGPNAGWKPHECKEETARILNEVFIDQENVWGIVVKEENRLIGSIGLVPDGKREYKRARMLGYAIAHEYWGHGFTTEAAKAVLEYGFHKLSLSLISAYCYPFNKASQRVMEKCGFTYEGTLRLAEKRFDGVLLDLQCLSITHEEFI